MGLLTITNMQNLLRLDRRLSYLISHLVVKNNTDERWYLIGITSYGFGCGNNGVYTRVSSFYNWILSQIKT
jgi:hypothetical protein